MPSCPEHDVPPELATALPQAVRCKMWWDGEKGWWRFARGLSCKPGIFLVRCQALRWLQMACQNLYLSSNDNEIAQQNDMLHSALLMQLSSVAAGAGD